MLNTQHSILLILALTAGASFASPEGHNSGKQKAQKKLSKGQDEAQSPSLILQKYRLKPAKMSPSLLKKIELLPESLKNAVDLLSCGGQLQTLAINHEDSAENPVEARKFRVKALDLYRDSITLYQEAYETLGGYVESDLKAAKFFALDNAKSIADGFWNRAECAENIEPLDGSVSSDSGALGLYGRSIRLYLEEAAKDYLKAAEFYNQINDHTTAEIATERAAGLQTRLLNPLSKQGAQRGKKRNAEAHLDAPAFKNQKATKKTVFIPQSKTSQTSPINIYRAPRDGSVGVRYGAFEIKPSRWLEELDFRGSDNLGVYALSEIPPGVQILEYLGRQFKSHDEFEDYASSHSAETAVRANAIDATDSSDSLIYVLSGYERDSEAEDQRRGVASFINHTVQAEANIVFKTVVDRSNKLRSRIVAETSRTIKAGEELLTYYGDQRNEEILDLSPGFKKYHYDAPSQPNPTIKAHLNNLNLNLKAKIEDYVAKHHELESIHTNKLLAETQNQLEFAQALVGEKRLFEALVSIKKVADLLKSRRSLPETRVVNDDLNDLFILQELRTLLMGATWALIASDLVRDSVAHESLKTDAKSYLDAINELKAALGNSNVQVEETLAITADLRNAVKTSIPWNIRASIQQYAFKAMMGQNYARALKSQADRLLGNNGNLRVVRSLLASVLNYIAGGDENANCLSLEASALYSLGVVTEREGEKQLAAAYFRRSLSIAQKLAELYPSETTNHDLYQTSQELLNQARAALQNKNDPSS